MKTEVTWHPVPGDHLPASAAMVLLWTPEYAGGYRGITYGWLNSEGRWMHNTALGATEILIFRAKGKYESAVRAWASMPETPDDIWERAENQQLDGGSGLVGDPQ